MQETEYLWKFWQNDEWLKRIEYLPQTIHACNPKSYTLDNLSYEFCWIIKSCFKKSKVYTIRLQIYGDRKIWVCVKGL